MASPEKPHLLFMSGAPRVVARRRQHRAAHQRRFPTRQTLLPLLPRISATAGWALPHNGEAVNDDVCDIYIYIYYLYIYILYLVGGFNPSEKY